MRVLRGLLCFLAFRLRGRPPGLLPALAVVPELAQDRLDLVLGVLERSLGRVQRLVSRQIGKAVDGVSGVREGCDEYAGHDGGGMWKGAAASVATFQFRTHCVVLVIVHLSGLLAGHPVVLRATVVAEILPEVRPK